MILSVYGLVLGNAADTGIAYIDSVDGATLNINSQDLTVTAGIADAYITTSDLLDINSVKNLTLTGGTDTFASIYTTAGGAITINDATPPTSSTLTMTGGTGDTGYASIYTDAGGSITAYFSNSSTIDANTSSAEIIAGKTSGTGSVTLNLSGTTSNLVITGGDAATTPNYARIVGTAGNVNITTTGALTIRGGTVANSDAYLQTLTSGDVILSVYGLIVGNAADTGDAYIDSVNGATLNLNSQSIVLTAGLGDSYITTEDLLTMNYVKDMTLTGGTNHFASINTTAGGAISINDSSLPLLSALTMTGGTGDNGYASIYTDTGGNITAYFSNNSIIDSSTSYAEINAGKSSGSGDIDLTINLGMLVGHSLTMTGGDALTADRFARIFANSGDVNVDLTGEFNLQGGSVVGAETYVATNTGDLFVHARGGTIHGGTALNTDAGFYTRYASGTGGDIVVQNRVGGNLILDAGTVGSGSAAIEVKSGTGSIFLDDLGDVTLTTDADGADSYIQTAGGAITIEARHLILDSSTADAGSNVRIQTVGADIVFTLLGDLKLYSGDAPGTNVYVEPLVSGNLNVSGRNVLLDAGEGSLNADVFLRTTDGNLSVNITADLSLLSSVHAAAFIDGGSYLDVDANNVELSGTDATHYAYLKSSSLVSGLSVTVNDDITLNGTSRLISSGGEVYILAGDNLTMNDSSVIQNTGASRLNVVVDNDNSAIGDIGLGAFTMAADASITSGGELRVYTATFLLNTIEGTLNGLPYTGTIAVEDDHNKYATWYPDGTYGVTYTVYYKSAGLPPVPETNALYLYTVMFELFYRLERVSNELNQLPTDFSIDMFISPGMCFQNEFKTGSNARLKKCRIYRD